jgi:hypothetical protein
VENCGDGNEVITNRCDSSDRAGRITAADFAYFVCLAAPAQADWRKAATLLRRLPLAGGPIMVNLRAAPARTLHKGVERAPSD